MKNIFKTFYLAIILITTNGYAQDAIKIKATFDSEFNVRLRWAPANFDQMKFGWLNGYKIERTKIAENGVPLDEQDWVTEEIYVMPFNSADQWESDSGINANIANAAQFLMVDQPLQAGEGVIVDPLSISDPKLSHAYNYKQTQDNRYGYALLLADQDFNIARGLALGFIDIKSDILVSGNTYRYRIMLNDREDQLQGLGLVANVGSVDIATTESSSLPPVTNLTAESGNKKIKLSWDGFGLDEVYSFYNIYRSVANGAFTKVNQNPFIFMSQNDKSSIISYNDSIPQNGIPYTYRVTGLSPFGSEGPYSDPVTVTGIPDPLPLGVGIKDIKKVNSKLAISWQTFSKLDSLPPDLSLVTGYEIVRSPDLIAPPVLVKQISGAAITSDSLTEGTDGYYFVEAIDQNGYRYPSVPQLFQAVDSFPPNTPSGLQARLNLDGSVRLTWNANTEPDMQGYKVFYSYRIDGPFNQSTSKPCKEPKFFTNSFNSSAQDSVFFAVMAVDDRENASAMSQPVLMVLPDKSGPSRPVLSQLLPRPEGIRVGWQLSQDEDLAHHFLQRKFKDATQWANLIKIERPGQYPPLPLTSAEVSPSNYVDTDTLQTRLYSYRMIAYDLSGNFSVSDVFDVKPYDDGLRGNVRPFTAKLKKQGQTYIANPALAGQAGGSQADLTNTNVGVHNNQWVKGSLISDGKVAELFWSYDTKFPSSLMDFSIYQKVHVPNTNPYATSSIDPNPFVLIRTVSKSDAFRIATANGKTGYMVHVEALNPEKYIPLIPTVDDKPGQAPTNTPITSPFEYKIIANHRDGGWSHEGKALLTKSN